jgi:hypothetical protein
MASTCGREREEHRELDRLGDESLSIVEVEVFILFN